MAITGRTWLCYPPVSIVGPSIPSWSSRADELQFGCFIAMPCLMVESQNPRQLLQFLPILFEESHGKSKQIHGDFRVSPKRPSTLCCPGGFWGESQPPLTARNRVTPCFDHGPATQPSWLKSFQGLSMPGGRINVIRAVKIYLEVSINGGTPVHHPF